MSPCRSLTMNDITLGEICNTLRGVWGEYVAEGF